MDEKIRANIESLITEEAERRSNAPPPRIRRPGRSTKILTAVLAVLTLVSFVAAVISTGLAIRDTRPQGAYAADEMLLEEVAELMPAASVQTLEHHFTVRVTDDWTRTPKADRDEAFATLCHRLANRFYHSATLEDLQGNMLARWQSGMIEIFR